MTIGILLAAGRGTRMKSSLPKVLFEISDEPMCMGPLRALMEVCDRVVVVVGYRGAEVKDAIHKWSQDIWDSKTISEKILFFTQEPPKGTGDAVKTAINGLGGSASLAKDFLVVNADLPLVRSKTLLKLRKLAGDSKLQSACLSMNTPRPAGLGRIVRDDTGVFMQIKEEKDSNADEKRIREVNGGVYFFAGDFLLENIQKLKSNNEQNEFYLTDLLGKGSRAKIRSEALLLRSSYDLMGVNTTFELAFARKISQHRIKKNLCESLGVDFEDPDTNFISAQAKFLGDCKVGSGTQIRGKSVLSQGCKIEGMCQISDSKIESGAIVLWSSVIEESTVGANSQVGPMAHLRPGSVLGKNVRIGNFVELKKTQMKDGSKAAHLSYLGNAEIGEEANIGCGTITCNYDGVRKHATKVGKKCFIGSDSQLVAPVTIGDHAYVGSGTTVTQDIPEGSLALSRPELIIKPGYAKKLADKLGQKG